LRRPICEADLAAAFARAAHRFNINGKLDYSPVQACFHALTANDAE
jgi:hypothetical protein